MFGIRNNKIFNIEIIKENKKGTGAWCKIKGSNKLKLISYSKIYDTEDEATKTLSETKKIKQTKEQNIQKKVTEIDNILKKIYSEFGIEIKFLSKPATKKDAWNWYYHLKNNKVSDGEI